MKANNKTIYLEVDISFQNLKKHFLKCGFFRYKEIVDLDNFIKYLKSQLTQILISDSELILSDNFQLFIILIQ